MKRFILLCLIGANLMAQNTPFKVDIINDYNPWTKQYDLATVVLTSTVDNLTIKDLIINKGHCTTVPIAKYFPRKLKYSEQFKMPYQCNLIRIDIKTNQGDWSVEY